VDISHHLASPTAGLAGLRFDPLPAPCGTHTYLMLVWLDPEWPLQDIGQWFCKNGMDSFVATYITMLCGIAAGP
jgi:hypothetical protein